MVISIFSMILKIVSFSHPFPKSLLSTYYMPGLLLSEIGLVLAPWSLHSVGETDHKQIGVSICNEGP